VAGVAERSAAVHAARALGAAFLVVAVDLEFLPVLERSIGAISESVWRSISMNPVGLPMYGKQFELFG
jgi:hypothetical protein